MVKPNTTCAKARKRAAAPVAGVEPHTIPRKPLRGTKTEVTPVIYTTLSVETALALAIPARTPTGRRPKSTQMMDPRGRSILLSWYTTGFL